VLASKGVARLAPLIRSAAMPIRRIADTRGYRVHQWVRRHKYVRHADDGCRKTGSWRGAINNASRVRWVECTNDGCSAAHHASVIATKGKSFRMRKRGPNQENDHDKGDAALPKTTRKA
jgi:hypothetical protein